MASIAEQGRYLVVPLLALLTASQRIEGASLSKVAAGLAPDGKNVPRGEVAHAPQEIGCALSALPSSREIFISFHPKAVQELEKIDNINTTCVVAPNAAVASEKILSVARPDADNLYFGLFTREQVKKVLEDSPFAEKMTRYLIMVTSLPESGERWERLFADTGEYGILEVGIIVLSEQIIPGKRDYIPAWMTMPDNDGTHKTWDPRDREWKTAKAG